MEWYIKAGTLVFTALIMVPYLYRKLRPDEPGILEGDYHVEASHESRKFGEFDPNDLPAADMPVFGGSMSTPGRYLEMETQKEWLHPDILRYRDTLKEKTETEEDEDEKVVV